MGDKEKQDVSSDPQSEDAGQLSAIQEDLSPPKPEDIVTADIVEKIVKAYNEDCELIEFSAELGTKIGDNYLSIMYAVHIKLKNKRTGEPEETDIMLKTMPRNALRQQMITESCAFVKEINMYTDIFPKMVAFQKEKGLEDSEIFSSWPKCYLTHSDGSTDYLALENMRPHGYKMANRLAGLNEEQASMMLKNIAKFHAISFAMYDGDSEKIMQDYPWLKEKMFPVDGGASEQLKQWWGMCMKNEAGMVRNEGMEKEAAGIEKVGEDDIFKVVCSLMDHKRKHAIICHGDFWTNNMLFGYVNDKLHDVKLIDFQLSRCASRCTDIGYFLHTSIPMALLNSNEEKLLRLYHDQFISTVTRLGVDPVAFGLTWDNLMDEYKVLKLYGVAMGLMLAPIVSAEAENVPDMEAMKMEDFSEDGAKQFLDQITAGKSDSVAKICNLAALHLPKCVQMNAPEK